MGEVSYTTREAIRLALDFKETVRDNARIDEAMFASSREIEGCLHRVFYPQVRERRFDWPNSQRAKPWRLWLDDLQLVELVSASSGGVNIPLGDLVLYPDSGPPYSRVEINLDSNSAFGSGSSHQNDVTLVGLWGYQLYEVLCGLSTAAMDDAQTTINVTNSSSIGVGHCIRADTERMLVIGRSMLDTTQDTTNQLDAQMADVLVGVADGTAFSVGEIVLVDGERMLIVDIVGNNLVVKRAWDGSVLATHSLGGSVYAPRTLFVERGALGTEAATHSDGSLLVRWSPPSLIQSLAKALSIDIVLQESAGWARTSGSGESERETRAAGLAKLWDKAYTAYGRMARTRGV